MLADVVTSATRWNSEQPLLTYLVPPAMEADLRAGQLVAVPYGERLVEGIVWAIHHDVADTRVGTSWMGPIDGAHPSDEAGLDHPGSLRPLHTILDPEPALLPHQRALASWISEYYVTPLAQVVMTMLTPGLVQRSQYVLRLA